MPSSVGSLPSISPAMQTSAAPSATHRTDADGGGQLLGVGARRASREGGGQRGGEGDCECEALLDGCVRHGGVGGPFRWRAARFPSGQGAL